MNLPNQHLTTNLTPNLVILPPKRTDFTVPSVSLCPPKYHDLIAIDIALLVNEEQSKWIVENINVPLQEYGSFPLNSSHFPHMSLVHTIVPRDVLPQLCADLEFLAQNFNTIVQFWYDLINSKKHPFYLYSENGNRNDNGNCITEKESISISLKTIPHLNNLQNDAELKDFIDSCQSQIFKPVITPTVGNTNQDTPTSHQFLCKSYLSSLFSLPASISSQPNTVNEFNWTTCSPGPMWSGDTTLPYIGYPNPNLTDDLSTTNGLNLRIFHDIVTTMIHPYRVSIWEAKPQENNDENNKNGPKQIDMKQIKTNGSDEVLNAIAQVVYFTGDGIVPCRVSQGVREENCNISTSINVTKHSFELSNSDNCGHIKTIINPLIKIKLNGDNTDHLVTDGDAKLKFFTTNQPFDAEPGDISTLKYTNAFDESYMGHKYNPHITIGSGQPELVKKFILDNINLVKNESNESKDNGPKAYLEMEPINVRLNECTIGVFQLGLNGSCRFPLYQTKLGLE